MPVTSTLEHLCHVGVEVRQEGEVGDLAGEGPPELLAAEGPLELALRGLGEVSTFSSRNTMSTPAGRQGWSGS